MSSNPIFLFQFQFLDHYIIDNHVEYTISILNPENGQTIFLKSRYSCLLDLHKILKQLHPNHFFPIFPPKKCIGNLNESFIAQRKKLLERYFNELFVEKIFFEDKFVKEFLNKTQINYEIALHTLKTIEETPNDDNNSDVQMKLALTHSRSINGLNLSLQRNLSYGASIRRSSSLKLEDFKKSPIFHTPSSNSKININVPSNEDFKLTDQLFPLDYFEWMNGILELQGFLLENELVLSLNEEKWVEKLKIKGIILENNENEEIYLGIHKEKNLFFEIIKYDIYKEETCKVLGNIVNQMCLSKYLEEYKEFVKYSKGYYKEHFEKKTGKVKCLLIIFKEKFNGKNKNFSLDYFLKQNDKLNEKKMLFIFYKIMFIIDSLIKSNLLISDIKLSDFYYDMETQEIKLANLKHCEFIKEGLLDNEKIDILKKSLNLLVRLKFLIPEDNEELLNIKLKELKDYEINEKDADSLKILKKLMTEEIKEIDETLYDFLNKYKIKRKRSLNFELNEVQLKKDRLKLAKLYFSMTNYNKAIKHLKKLERETFEHIDYSKLNQNDIQELINLKRFIIKTLKKSDCNALFFEDYLFKVLKLHREHIPERNNSFFSIIKKICKFYISIQDYNKAIDVLTQEIFNSDNELPLQYSVEFNRILSISYRELDDHNLALTYIDKAISLLETSPSSLKVKKADLIKEKALIYTSTNQENYIKEGIKLLNKALNIYKESYENSEIDLANTKELIGNCCMKINEFGLAVQTLEESWAIKKSISFTVPQSFENLLLNLAKCHYGLKDLSKAQSFLSQTITLIKDKKSNPDELKPGEEKKLMHIEAELRALKANICIESEKYGSAKNNYRKALKLYKKVAGKSNIILGELYESYGKVSLRLKDVEKAKKCFLRSLTIFRLNLGESDARTLEVAEAIADLDFQLGEYEDCLLSYQELVDIYKDKYPQKEEEISDYLIRLGFINFKINQYSEALDNFREAGIILLGLEKKYFENHEKISKVKSKLLTIQKDISRIEEMIKT